MSENKVRKFQPYITPENSYNLSDVEHSMNCLFMNLKCIEEFTKNNPECTVNYVLTDESTSSNLVPIRNEKREFLVFFTLKEGY